MPGVIVNGTLTSGELGYGEQNLWNIIQVCEANHPTGYGEFFKAVCKTTASAIAAMPGHLITVQKAPYQVLITGPFFNLTYQSDKTW